MSKKHFVSLVDCEETPITSKEELAEAHATVARNLHLKQEIEIKTQKQIQDLQQEAIRQVGALNEATAKEFSRIHAYMKKNHNTLLLGASAKSVGTPTGRVGWKKDRDSVELLEDEATLIERLKKQLGDEAADFIIVKESLNKRELLTRYHQIQAIKGFEKIVGKDAFYLAIAGTELEVRVASTTERLVVQP